MIKAIVCVDENWGIGKDNKLLFVLPSDLLHFKNTTLNNNVLMGKNTFESLPFKAPLPMRNNIIVSTNPNLIIKKATVVSSIEEGIKAMNDDGFIIGGESIYKQCLPYCEECIVTKVYTNTNADKFFPNLDNNNEWKIEHESQMQYENGLQFQIIYYKRCEP